VSRKSVLFLLSSQSVKPIAQPLANRGFPLFFFVAHRYDDGATSSKGPDYFLLTPGESMAAQQAPAKRATNVRILVLGDVNLDSLIVPLPQERERAKERRMAWQIEDNCWLHRRRGGAWLLTEIINAALASPSFKYRFGKITAETYKETLCGVSNRTITSSSLLTDYLSSSVILRLYPQAANGQADDKKQVYRVERILGWTHSKPEIVGGKGEAYKKRLAECLEHHVAAPRADRDILVLHDRASYFRGLPPPLLKKAIGSHFNANKTWIVWNMSSPLAEGNLWSVFQQNKTWLNRTIAVVKMECLRQEGVNLPQMISLEQESHLFLQGIKAVKSLERLAHVRHIVAHQHQEGVLHYDREIGLQTSCYYCPNIRPTNDPSDRGIMVGYTAILIAAIVRGMAWSLLSTGKHPEEGIVAGMKQGAVLDHLHYHKGFGDRSIAMNTAEPAPYNDLFATLSDVRKSHWEHEGIRYSVAALPLEAAGGDLSTWSRIEGFIKQQAKEQHTSIAVKAERTARAIVRLGLRAVVEEETKLAPPEDFPDTPGNSVRCPYEIHGKIQTAYRDEIDGFGSIRRIIEKYLNDQHWKTPLSIAVFGEPGSGKSFTIQQILGTIDPDMAKRPLKFNLAQVEEAKEFETAFHKVQDVVVAGETPLVFFDEFEAKNCEWLRCFLAPMQDGEFKAGESIYRIGRAIFVFAGGRFKSWDEFHKAVMTNDVLKNLKGPDFVSRLRGHLDIKTINCRGKAKTVDGVLMFRRAVLLRSLLEHCLPQIIDNLKEARIAANVVRAFLRVTHYVHEARSMQAIIEMSRPSPLRRFEQSSLPAVNQLRMHVNAKQFCRLLADGDIGA
jgi:hypothetical protein